MMRTDWPERRHGNDGVPEGVRDAGEGRIVDVLLGVVHDRREDDDGHAQREHEEAQLAGAGRQGLAEDPQTGRVARKFEDAEDAEHAERDERAAHFLVLRNAQADIVRQDRHEVNHRHHRSRMPAYPSSVPRSIQGRRSWRVKEVLTLPHENM